MKFETHQIKVKWPRECVEHLLFLEAWGNLTFSFDFRQSLTNSPGLPGTCYLDQASIELTAFPVLELKTCATTPSWNARSLRVDQQV